MTDAGVPLQDLDSHFVKSFSHQTAPALADQGAGLVDGDSGTVFTAVLEAEQAEECQAGSILDRAGRIVNSEDAAFIMYHVRSPNDVTGF